MSGFGKEKETESNDQTTPFVSDSEIIQDIEYAKKLREWINDDDFFFKMKKGFSAKRDGFDCYKWHDICDGKGKTLVIIKTKDNYIFGGFTEVGFTKDKSKYSRLHTFPQDFIRDSNAFIFSLRNDKGDRKPEKFPIKNTKETKAIFYNKDWGTYFGEADFSLNSNLQPGYSNFGATYNLPNGIIQGSKEAKSYLAGSYYKWVVDELETHFI
ncbi:pep-cterm sorting domain-containing protein [Anaeramoeba ignava]|uniref:Pep-cterm sorting domain-containing protein n=1 Tax=Anaeramoeba ignava TaxID=1746090 RepID=A0A9Q0LA52_ANAIG|nr:pep-cterm sorting domain-containing protein [Anaeramoeba ignava]